MPLNCGFVEWEWRGKNRVYRLNHDLAPILSGIEKHLHRDIETAGVTIILEDIKAEIQGGFCACEF